MKDIYVINSLGEKEPFSLRKLYFSCRNSGLGAVAAMRVAVQIEKEVYPSIKTCEISEKIKRLLENESPRSAIRFYLKRAMRELGPAGFTFEKYIGQIFNKNGYRVKLNQKVLGFCGCSYEIDFLAEKGNVVYIGECKYHNLAGERVDLKIALANYARFLDIAKGSFFKTKRLKSILVTNTKFTSEVIKYSKCTGVDMLGWKYPRERGLEHLIEKEKLYPVTILPSFKGYLKEIFAQKGKMLVSDLLDNPVEKISEKLGVKEEEIRKLVREAKILLE